MALASAGMFSVWSRAWPGMIILFVAQASVFMSKILLFDWARGLSLWSGAKRKTRLFWPGARPLLV